MSQLPAAAPLSTSSDSSGAAGCLWQPSAERIAASNMTAFMAAVQRDHDIALPDYASLYQWSIDHPQDFWKQVWDFCGVIAATRGETVLTNGDRMPGAQWFPQARLNYAENLLRRKDDAVAITFRNEAGAESSLTFAELQRNVSVLAQALRASGVKSGDRIAGYLPNIPGAVTAMLAATSIGAIWSSCSPDFGMQGVLDRFGQIEPKILFSVEGYCYNSNTIDLIDRLAEIVQRMPSVEKVVVMPYLQARPDVSSVPRAIGLADFTFAFQPGDIEFEQLPFDHPLYIMFSSGTTGVPKCIVHGAGGTLLQHLKEHALHTDIKRDDVLFYFTTCGWMMWNWLVSGLASGCTIALYEGSPFMRRGHILFDYIDAVGITAFGVSAKYLDAAAKTGLKPHDTHKLSALRTIMSTGSPLVAETFDYVYTHIKSDIDLASISGGTDIISCFVLGNPVIPVWRGECQCRGLGLAVDVYDDSGKPVRGQKGELVCIAPFPSMPVSFWNDADGARYRAAYFERFPGIWCHGDYVELTEHDGLIIYGRSDAVLNPGGVRIGTAEIYRQVEQVDEVAESLAIGQDWPPNHPNEVRVVLFVRLRDGVTLDQALTDKIKQRIRANATPRHVPARIVQVADIPRTKSGKIVELAVRNVVHNKPVKNLEALANPEALALFKDRPELAI